jgi:glycosyltransferase involved in cell wall biosynthesis
MPPTFHPDIAVIIPVYNAIQYLDECLNSIVSQTYRELEIILVDDGSTDGSEKVCDQWSAKDNRISVIHQSNSSEAAARIPGFHTLIADLLLG